ncbi:MauE/DoxX family redox-associated membrane protein [Streptomyces sp. NPDC087300]|uniref:MauE/DoxX family redox-associated membrane protein n=1 Tax=Streptomyces sp. NPDC087300 TaxID=3365780 RepID=UPI00380E82B1
MPYVTLALRCLVGVVFLVSASSKVAGRGRFAAFRASVDAMGVLPARRVPLAARLVVGTECAVPLLLVSAPSLGFALACGLLVAFTAGIAGTLRRGAAVPCRCFGASARPLGRAHVVRNALLTCCTLTGEAGVLLSESAGAGGAAGSAALFAGACCAGLVVLLDDLIDLFRPVRAPVR